MINTDLEDSATERGRKMTKKKRNGKQQGKKMGNGAVIQKGE